MKYIRIHVYEYTECPLPCALAFPPPSYRDATTPSPCWAPHLMTQERIMFSNPTPSKPRLFPATTMSDDTPSVLTPPLHCACLGNRNLLICRSLCPSSIPARYLSVVLNMRSARPTSLLLSTKPEFILLWQWDLCEPSIKRDPRSLPCWCCRASTTTRIVRSARKR